MGGLFTLALLVLNGPLLAADPSGKLWVQRPSSKPVPAPKPARKFLKKPVQPSIYGEKPIYREPARKILTQGAGSSSGGGIVRETLPPLQNAPVAKDYGPVSRGRAPSYNRPRPNIQRSSRADLPPDLWRGIDFTRFRDAVLKLDGNGGSFVLNNLAAQALLDRRSQPGNVDPRVYELLKMVVLYRMGRIGDLADLIASIPQNGRSLPVDVFQARALLASGQTAKACSLTVNFPVGDPGLSKDLLSEALMMTALCAAQKKDLQTLGLIADLARDKGVRSPLSYAVIDYLVSGAKPVLKIPAKLGVRDYYFLRLIRAKTPHKILDLAEPALIYALAHDRAGPPVLRLDAAERAASRGQIDAAGLAAIYRDVVASGSAAKRGKSDSLTRALLFDGLSRSNDPQHRAKIIDTLLANARGVHLSAVMGTMLAPYVKQMQPQPALDWFAMRAVEVALLSGEMQMAEQWFLFVRQAGRGAYAAAEWLPLADLVQVGVVPSGEGMQMALRMAKARRLDGRALHGLTSVLDALSFTVPIPLWNTAGKIPQPNKGALPPGGVLSRLKKMSDEGRSGEVLLLALEAVGRHSADQMHLIALGDIVKSLKQTGFARQANQFGFEALYGIWPTGQRRQK